MNACFREAARFLADIVFNDNSYRWQVLEMVAAKDIGGMNALMLAATQNENDSVYETLVTRVTRKRTEREVTSLFPVTPGRSGCQAPTPCGDDDIRGNITAACLR